MNEENKIIELNGIGKVYKTGDENTTALDGIDLIINEGEFVAITGPSGSGKSTLMHILGLLDTASNGVYKLDRMDVSRISKKKQAAIRNQKIGFVFQQFNLLPKTKVLDNVLLPSIYGSLPQAISRASEVIEQVGLSDRINHRSNQLSGGQIQRVAIARALVMKPSIILADEPTGNLDTKKTREIMELFEKINKNGATVIVITHEPAVAKFAKRIIQLSDGKVLSDSKAAK